MTIVELVSSISVLIAIYCLAHGNYRAGWAVGFFSHILTIVVMWGKQQEVSAFFQGLSALVSIVGAIKPDIALAVQGRRRGEKMLGPYVKFTEDGKREFHQDLREFGVGPFKVIQQSEEEGWVMIRLKTEIAVKIEAYFPARVLENA